MFKKFKEQISCIECASITAEEIYLADKRNPPLRRPPPSHHDDFYVRSRTASTRSSVNSSFAPSHSSYVYQQSPTRRDRHRSSSLPGHGHGHRHSDSVTHHRDRPPSRTSSLHNQSYRSAASSESYMQPQHPSIRRVQKNEVHFQRNSRDSSSRVTHSSFDGARNDSSFQNERGNFGDTMGVQMRNTSSHSQRQDRPHSATATLVYERPRSKEAPPVSLRNRENSAIHPLERRHSTSAMDQEVPQPRGRSVSFAGSGPNTMQPLRRRARSVSGAEDLVDKPGNMCDALSNSLVSIVKTQWHSNPRIASDSECFPSSAKQVKSILKKPCSSIDSDSPRVDKKLRAGSVTFADNYPSWRESSVKHKHISHGRNSPVPFSDTRATLPGGQRRSTLQDIPDGYDDGANLAKIKRVQHKPPLPHGTKFNRMSRELSDDIDHTDLAHNSGGPGTLPISAEVTQAANFDYTQNTHMNRKTPTPTLSSPKTVPKKFVVKRDISRRSSIDSDNCSSSLSSESSLMDTKLSLRNTSHSGHINPAMQKSTSLDRYHVGCDEDTNQMDSAAIVPSIRKGRSTSRRNRKPASASMSLQRIDSDTTDSGLSLDYSTTPLSSLDLPQYRRAQRMQKRNTMSLPRDMQFSSNLETTVLTFENETTDPIISTENPLMNKQPSSESVQLILPPQENSHQVYDILPDTQHTAPPENRNSSTLQPNSDINHMDGELITCGGQQEPDNTDNLITENSSPKSARTKKGSKKGEHKKKHPKRTTKKLKKQKNVTDEEHENLPGEGKQSHLTYENLPEEGKHSCATYENLPEGAGHLRVTNTNEPCSEEFPPPPPPLPEVYIAEGREQSADNTKSVRRTEADGVTKQSFVQSEFVTPPPKRSQTQHTKTLTAIGKSSSFSGTPPKKSDRRVTTKDFPEPGKAPNAPQTFAALDVPGSADDTASIQTRGSFSDFTIQQYDDASLRSYMDQNDVSGVLVPRDTVRTGRLMMKDETNTFCMCSGTFRTSVSPRDSESKWRPITLQIYRGLNDKEDRINLLKNTTVLLQLRHENLHAVYGMCLDGSPHTREGREVFILLERTHYLVNLNRLLAWTSENNPQLMTTGCAITFALQMSDGLQFLEDKGIIHANLSSNTIRLDRYCTLKIGGIEQFPVSSTAAPIRWMALETLSKGQILPKSTVWTFGVVLWEILSVGGRPYQSLKIGQILNRLNKGHRLPRPQTCSQFLYHFLLNCWQPNPEERPSFPEITKTLSEYKNKLLPSKPPAEIFPDREDFWKIMHDQL